MSENGQTPAPVVAILLSVKLDSHICYRALAARDRRFDGVFFVGVRTTGVYCRPICPARTPRLDRCVFFAHAAEAERQGFRACFRCRPELAPGTASVDALPRLVGAAMGRIQRGYLNARSVEALAEELGVSARHLHRSLSAALGVTPVELAQSRRLALAKQLLQDTTLSMTDIALASGFASVRRFNALFRARLGRAPTALRRLRALAETPDRGGRGEPRRKAPKRSEGTRGLRAIARSGAERAGGPEQQIGLPRATGVSARAPSSDGAAGGLVVRLDYRPPFDWEGLLEFIAPRAVPGVEAVADGAYGRTVRLGELRGWVRVTHDPKRLALRAEIAATLTPALMRLVVALRLAFDLDAQPWAVDAHLRRDPRLAPLVRARPGVRLPGGMDGSETVLRAVLGQQVSVRGATTLSGRLAARFGEPLATPFATLTHLAPQPEVLARAGVDAIAQAVGLPRRRAETLVGLARAAASGELRLDDGGRPEEVMPHLAAIPGIGPWTLEYVAMRALGWPDAFPASDLGLRRALGTRSTRETAACAERWRPWRSYAAMRLWLQGQKGSP
jgi:AraC family transcriptional regulator of adaptative response / DNA-3-methyladenine glycosylase II